MTDYFSDDSSAVGHFIEKELGIKCRSVNTRYYVNWENFLQRIPVSDYLDVITAVIKFKPNRSRYKERSVVHLDFLSFARRVFIEQNLAYLIDDLGGIHPAIDPAFADSSAHTIRCLKSAGLEAAAQHILDAEKHLLAGSLNPRLAIRSCFDAVENLHKMINKNSPQLNKASIINELMPILKAKWSKDESELRATEKLVNSMTDWVEAAHFFRHADGNADISQPSEAFAVLFVSQGFSFARWLAEAYSQ